MASSFLGLWIPSPMRVIVRVWVGSMQFSAGHGSRGHIHSQTPGRREMAWYSQGWSVFWMSRRATGVSSASPVLCNNSFSSSSLTPWPLLGILSVSSPLCCGSQCSVMCPVVVISASAPGPQPNSGNVFPVEHHGARACPTRGCTAASCPDGQGNGAGACFFPFLRCAWGPALQYSAEHRV